MQVADTPASRNSFVEYGSSRHFLDVLTEVPHSESFRDRNIALVGRFLPHNHPEECCLTRAVRPHKADLLARIELKAGIYEENLASILLADSGKRNHTNQLA